MEGGGCFSKTVPHPARGLLLPRNREPPGVVGLSEHALYPCPEAAVALDPKQGLQTAEVYSLVAVLEPRSLKSRCGQG